MHTQTLETRTKVLQKVSSQNLSPTSRYIEAGTVVRLGKQEYCFHESKMVPAFLLCDEPGAYYVLKSDLDPINRDHLETARQSER